MPIAILPTRECPSLTADLCLGLAVANKTPGEQLQKLSTEMSQILEELAVRKKYATFGVRFFGRTAVELYAFINGVGRRWSGLVRAANVHHDLVPKPRHVSFE